MKGAKAKKILVESELKEGTIATSVKLASLPKQDRRAIISKLSKTEEAKIAAAIEIQRVFRGYCTRCRLLNVLYPETSHLALYSESKHHVARLKDVRSPSPPKSVKSASSKSSGRQRLEEYYNSYIQRMLHAGHGRDSPSIISFEEFCANYIQNWWSEKTRGKSAKSSATVPSKPTAALKKKKKKREGPLRSTEAACIIQKAWRRHIDVQVFRYYRDLINFKQRGDPAMMLRCINPQEAKLLDAASGIHIKFRLAGEKFPPNIYYKIYTHRPVQDLCANSPKDYTKADSKRKMARDVHNKGKRVPYLDTEGWYQRLENNGWRLVSDRLIHHIMSDPITWETSKKKVDFHHNKLKRKQDVEKKKKLKKIDWMKKMYKAGQLRAKVDDKETVELIEGAAAGMVATIDSHGPGAIQDWEVDELLDWTTSLNFDDYWGGWKEIATSGLSEKAVEDRIRMFTSAAKDPYEVRITADQNYPSFHAQHNTPPLISAGYRY